MIARTLSGLATFAAALVAMPAQACMASGPDGYVSGLVWETEAEVVPSDAVSLRIYADRPVPGTWMGFIALVLDGPPEFEGREIPVLPQNLNSCVGLGMREGYLVVRIEVIEREIDGELMTFYEAIDYLPSEENERQRRHGEENWVLPGEANEREELPF